MQDMYHYVPETNHIFRVYRVSHELRSVFQDLIPELMLSPKHHTHMGPIRNGSGVTSFFKYSK
jgi:hypothetical protein